MLRYTKLHGKTIFGDWDDTYGHQVLVCWDNSETCSVFVLDGTDYGGGIATYSEEASCEKIKEFRKTDDNWTFYKLCDDYIKTLQK